MTEPILIAVKECRQGGFSSVAAPNPVELGASTDGGFLYAQTNDPFLLRTPAGFRRMAPRSTAADYHYPSITPAAGPGGSKAWAIREAIRPIPTTWYRPLYEWFDLLPPGTKTNSTAFDVYAYPKLLEDSSALFDPSVPIDELETIDLATASGLTLEAWMRSESSTVQQYTEDTMNGRINTSLFSVSPTGQVFVVAILDMFSAQYPKSNPDYDSTVLSARFYDNSVPAPYDTAETVDSYPITPPSGSNFHTIEIGTPGRFEWHHVAMSIDRATLTMRFFVDGAEIPPPGVADAAAGIPVSPDFFTQKVAGTRSFFVVNGYPGDEATPPQLVDENGINNYGNWGGAIPYKEGPLVSISQVRAVGRPLYPGGPYTPPPNFG
jgi:hypothetical protein